MSDANQMGDPRLAFCEEARDLLIDLEAALLELENDPRDAETIGRVFRALHTIKGSGAMFGFDEVASFTHNLESAYDLVRSGELAVTPALISLTLCARDHILHLLESSLGHTALNRTPGLAILGAIREFADVRNAVPPPVDLTSSVAALKEFKIRFAPPVDLFLRGSNLLPLFDELRELGDLDIHADISARPPLAELLPDHCYLVWNLRLSASCTPEAIRDVFLFVDDGESLTITAVEDAPEVAPADEAVETPPGENPGTAARPATTSLRVPAAKLDELINIVGELVTIQARLTRFATQSGDIEIAHIAEETERLTSLLRDNTMSLRMLPLEATFARYRRLVRDLAGELGKQIDLSTVGGDTELDKSVIDQIADPLVHLIRNSVDHGIETPEQRRRLGKPACGRLVLSASHSGSQVLIQVSDDGNGIDPVRVRAKAIEKGLVDPRAELSESEIFSLIFRTGFSTAASVSSVSGRGVGMDVVKRNVESLRGSIDVTSTLGQGTVFTLKLPLTLAIIDGLLVRVAAQYFVFPVVQVIECLEVKTDTLLRGREFIEVRGKLVPLVFLHRFFRLGSGPGIRTQILVAQTTSGDFGFVVDAVIGDHKTVIKQLGPLCQQVEAVSGATILGDGSIALILDVDKLAHSALADAARPTAFPYSWTGPPTIAACTPCPDFNL